LNAIVTGSSGFVGSHLVERLLAEGFHVICLTRPSSDPAWIRRLPVEFRPLDDPQALAGADFVFHVAGVTRARTAAEYLAANSDPTRRLLQAVPPSVQRFVYVSSIAAVGPNPTAAPMNESTPPHPYDFYGQSKRAGECVVLEAAARLPVTIVRPPSVYGPRDTNGLAVMRAALRWGIVPVIGGGQKHISLIHVQDLAEGLCRAALQFAAAGQTYFVSGGNYTMEEFAAALAAALNKPLRLLRVPGLVARLAGEWGQLKWALTGKPQIVSRRKMRDLLQPRWTCSWEKAGLELAYEPRFTLEEGLRQTAAWYRENGWL
jgi:nucleoside-diphosphate-sugar epimerase